MRRKSPDVETKFHWMLNAFLWEVDDLYKKWDDELVITSGSEASKFHGYTSLHYATPCQAADIRIWDHTQDRGKVPRPSEQHAALVKLACEFCKKEKIPVDWIEIVAEFKRHHIHIEFQPKRLA